MLMNVKKMFNLGFKPQYIILDEDKDNRLDTKVIEMSPNGLYCFEIRQILHQSDNPADKGLKLIK